MQQPGDLRTLLRRDGVSSTVLITRTGPGQNHHGDALCLSAEEVLALGSEGLASLRDVSPKALILECRGMRLTTRACAGSGDPRVHKGERFQLARAPSDCSPGLPALICSDSHAVAALSPGARVWIGQSLGARVVERRFGTAVLEVTECPTRGKRLKAGKTIRLPDTPLALAGLSEEEHQAILVAARHLDLLILPAGSGASSGHLVPPLLRRAGRRKALPVVIRIDDRAALEQLPQWLQDEGVASCAGVLLDHRALALDLGAGAWAREAPAVMERCQQRGLPLVGELDEADLSQLRCPGGRAERLIFHRTAQALLLPLTMEADMVATLARDLGDQATLT
ncbi:hypothetical protein [Niveibacterium sp. SC-1]|uniref:hypothetical protein n=1 Tax=Niveibacterium sp. SC-1 TaxID=3135646 RepID=UPI00311E2C36